MAVEVNSPMEGKVHSFLVEVGDASGATVEQMEAANTEGVPPMAHPLSMSQRLRADEVTESDQREQFQRIAPRVEAGLYLVPKVIE